MRSMRGAVQGRDTSVRGIISKGRFVQGAQYPRTFGPGHIGRGHMNPASHQNGEGCLQWEVGKFDGYNILHGDGSLTTKSLCFKHLMVPSHKGTLDTERKSWLVCHGLRKTPFFQCSYIAVGVKIYLKLISIFLDSGKKLCKN
jgi:hypothetical protein